MEAENMMYAFCSFLQKSLNLNWISVYMVWTQKLVAMNKNSK